MRLFLLFESDFFQSSSTRKKRGLQAQNQQQTQNSNDLIDESSLIENENSNNSLIHQQSNNRLLGDQSELKDESVANRYDLVDNEEVQQNQPNPTETVTEIVEDQTMRITDNQSGEISMQSNSGKRLEPCDNNDDSSPPRKSSRIAKK